jgi:hypothetical protein
MKIILKYGAGIAGVMALVTLLVIHVIGIEQEWARRFMMLMPLPVLFASILLGIKERKIFLVKPFFEVLD